ncbi:ABC transporter ATP-binding protein [Lysobacter silvisoli]|uniref:ABC transporter ATP-binding protein n=1 Tax=Lysobacter silvisoli TaxID=2293254 RepID=A0A371K435_9GAMM|nr:ABC transporter ATP-binding protein [Lysobacter silvisoli]RDZ28630.1 ABC transporter ATP-binding protein [Lysobacter silvisoli]
MQVEYSIAVDAPAAEIGAADAAPGRGAVVAFADVCKSYGRHRALNRVSFDIPAGEIVALVGPNGAGKTTMLEIMMGLRRADDGAVSVLGCDPAIDRSYVSRIGVQIQQTKFFGSLSGRDYIRFFQRVYPRCLSIDAMVDEFELRAFIDRPLGKISGGERQRIALALAMINEPEFVILDEPTVGLDPIMRREFWAIIRKAHASGRKTLLFSTHHMEEAEALASRVIMLTAGRIVAQGSVAQLVSLAGEAANNLDDAYNILVSKSAGGAA